MDLKILVVAASFVTLAALPSAARAQHDHAGMGHQMAGDHGAPATAMSGQAIEIAVTSDGFVPTNLKVKQGQPVKLVVTRKTERTCATEIVIKDQGIDRKLPLNQPVVIAFTPKKTGQLRYACGMDMISGVIVVE